MAKELTIQTIRQAQTGDMKSLSAVAEQVRKKVYTYIYRLTLDYHLTQDLAQETVLEMIKTLPKLDVPHVNGFWAGFSAQRWVRCNIISVRRVPDVWPRKRPQMRPF